MTGKPLNLVSLSTSDIARTLAFLDSDDTGLDITLRAFNLLLSLYSGTFSIRNGTLLNMSAFAYRDRLKSRPTVKEIPKVKMIGRNKFTFSVVSSMMTAREKERRE